MSFSLSNFSISKQILIGYVPVLIVLGFLAFSSFQNFKKFNQSFDALQGITKENVTFLEIERDVVELQRNVLVYAYVGYGGVLRKIKFTQVQLEEKFDFIKPIASRDKEIDDRFDRMFGHYNKYKEGFESAIEEKKRLGLLNDEQMRPLIERAHIKIESIEAQLIKANNFKMAHEVSQIELGLFEASTNIKSFRTSPDSMLVSETRALILNVKKKVADLKGATNDIALASQLDEFLQIFEDYQGVFKDIIRVNRNYMYLINVVLAGKAAEMGTLSTELDRLITARSQDLSFNIKDNINRSQKQFMVLSLLAGLIGLVSSVMIAQDITQPVRGMANTLFKLSAGEVGIEIPGQERQDEVGQMAKAANAFKIMARDLKEQTAELEEFSYRTSHDLRSPLVSSIGLLNMAQEAIETKDYDTAAKSLGFVQGSLEKLELLVKDILDLTRTKNSRDAQSEVNLSNLIQESLNKLAHMDNFKRLDVQKNLEFDDVFLSQDTRLMLIIENLISNAIKYQDVSEKKSFVKISTYARDEFVIFEIEDNGLGIPKKQQDQMFGMFKRFHPKVSFGSGLGLYMMKKSVDILGGTIEFEDMGNGAKFTVSVPK